MISRKVVQPFLPASQLPLSGTRHFKKQIQEKQAAEKAAEKAEKAEKGESGGAWSRAMRKVGAGLAAMAPMAGGTGAMGSALNYAKYLDVPAEYGNLPLPELYRTWKP